jgi:pimeloyl-ACP methyl ester carboxylesterase
MGGMIAQLVALEHPERVDRLVLMSTNFGGHGLEPPHPDAMRLFDPSEFLTLGRDPEAMMRFTLNVITAPGFSHRAPADYDVMMTGMLANVRAQPTHPGAFMAQLQAILTSDRSELVRSIRHPTLVLHGAQDKLIPPSNGERLAERIPNSRLVLLDDVGHMPMLEMHERTASEVLSFLA